MILLVVKYNPDNVKKYSHCCNFKSKNKKAWLTTLWAVVPLMFII